MRHSDEVMVEVSLIKVASPFGRMGGVEVSKLKLMCLRATTLYVSEDIGKHVCW